MILKLFISYFLLVHFTLIELCKHRNLHKAVFRIRGKSNTFPDLLGKGVQIKTSQKLAAISFVLQAPTEKMKFFFFKYPVHTDFGVKL